MTKNKPIYLVEDKQIDERLRFYRDLSIDVRSERDKSVYYILYKEIQECLVKIKMLFLRSLEICISSREINLCRLDTFPTVVANMPVMYNRVPAFGLH